MLNYSVYKMAQGWIASTRFNFIKNSVSAPDNPSVMNKINIRLMVIKLM